MRGLLMAQRQGRDSCEKPHARGGCRLAVKGAAKAAIEISFQDRPKVGGAVPQTAAICQLT